MTDPELLQARMQKWRLDGQPVRTLDDARTFFESVGFCLMYPMRPAILVPTFIGAWVGADDKLPARQHAYNDPRAKEATELMVRALRDKAAYEAPLIDENNAFLLAPSVFPYFYSLVGERNPRQAPTIGPRSPYSPLACDAFEIIRRRGPISKTKLGEMLGGSQGLVLGFVFAAGTNLASYWFSDKIVLAMYGARQVGPDNRLYGIVERLAGRRTRTTVAASCGRPRGAGAARRARTASTRGRARTASTRGRAA